ncbi:MAG: dTDP-4-dehydrorhamnose reductase [Patiriisocius sp.]|jgi:dTDP-4-dehydrorhamnose reductase
MAQRDINMKLKVLVLGSTGLIGHQVFNYLNKTGKYEMYNITYRKKLNNDTILCNIRNQEEFVGVLKTISPDIIVNCIGVLINGANLDPENAIFINAYMPHKLMKLSNELNCKLIHISTDCVFSGNKGISYIEEDFKDGKDTYAKSKGLGEIINDTHLTLRTSVIGPELKSDGEELFHWFMSQSGEIKGFTKAIWSGVTTLMLAKVVDWSIDKKTTGLYHVTNNKSINKFELLSLLKKYTRKNISIVPVEGKIANKSFIDTRKELNFIIPDYEEMVKELVLLMKGNENLYKQYNLGL